MAEKKLISIVVPVFNEQENVWALYEAVSAVWSELSTSYDFELLFTDNHSIDRTFEVLQEIVKRDARVRALRFSRNFGFQRSIYTGFVNARGAAAIQLDCDLQDPPELIPQFLQKWEQGFQVVYGQRAGRKESWAMNLTRRTFYRLIDSLSEDDLPHDAGDFRLVDRKILEQLKNINDYQPYLRGTIATLGFNQVGIPYDRAERKRGESKFDLVQLFGLALDGILNHSVVPLRIATFIGMGISALTLLGGFIYLVGKAILGKPWPPGFTTLAILILSSISLNALFLGIIGEYIGRIYQQVKQRPLAIIEAEIGQAVDSRHSPSDPRTSRSLQSQHSH